eukprot:1636910-Prymnesium_polylepis.1
MLNDVGGPRWSYEPRAASWRQTSAHSGRADRHVIGSTYKVSRAAHAHHMPSHRVACSTASLALLPCLGFTRPIRQQWAMVASLLSPIYRSLISSNVAAPSPKRTTVGVSSSATSRSLLSSKTACFATRARCGVRFAHGTSWHGLTVNRVTCAPAHTGGGISSSINLRS